MAYVFAKSKADTLPLKRVLAILYLADVAHFRKYGRPVTGTRYQAYPHGPLPIDFYNLLKGEPIWLDELVSAHHFLPFHCVADQVERTEPTCFRLRTIAKTVSYDPTHFLSPSDRTALAGVIRKAASLKLDNRDALCWTTLTCRWRRTRAGMWGCGFTELMAALGVLLSAPNWAALTVCEVNPEHG
jgi:Antitoxin SocA-like, Panacea domain